MLEQIGAPDSETSVLSNICPETQEMAQILPEAMLLARFDRF